MDAAAIVDRASLPDSGHAVDRAGAEAVACALVMLKVAGTARSPGPLEIS